MKHELNLCIQLMTGIKNCSNVGDLTIQLMESQLLSRDLVPFIQIVVTKNRILCQLFQSFNGATERLPFSSN